MEFRHGMTGKTASEIHRIFRDPVVVPLVLINTAVAALHLFPILPPEQADYLLDFWSMVPVALLGIMAPWVGLSPLEPGRERTFWALWSVGFFFILTIRLAYILVPGVDSVISGAVGVDLLYTLFYLSLLLSLLVRTDRPHQELDGGGIRILEAGGTGVFVLAVFASFVFVPQTFVTSEYETWVPSLLMYWTLDLFLLLTLLYLRRTSPSADWRTLYLWLAGTSGESVADAIRAGRGWEGRHRFRTADGSEQ